MCAGHALHLSMMTGPSLSEQQLIPSLYILRNTSGLGNACACSPEVFHPYNR